MKGDRRCGGGGSPLGRRRAQEEGAVSSSSKRTVFTKYQLSQLERRFTEQTFLSKEERAQLAEQLGLTEKQIMIWFQNRRGRLKRRGPADLAYTREKLKELHTRRPYPFLYGLLSSVEHRFAASQGRVHPYLAGKMQSTDYGESGKPTWPYDYISSLAKGGPHPSPGGPTGSGGYMPGIPGHSGFPHSIPGHPGVPSSIPGQPGAQSSIPGQPGFPLSITGQPGFPHSISGQPGFPSNIPGQPGIPGQVLTYHPAAETRDMAKTCNQWSDARISPPASYQGSSQSENNTRNPTPPTETQHGAINRDGIYAPNTGTDFGENTPVQTRTDGEEGMGYPHGNDTQSEKIGSTLIPSPTSCTGTATSYNYPTSSSSSSTPSPTSTSNVITDTSNLQLEQIPREGTPDSMLSCPSQVTGTYNISLNEHGGNFHAPLPYFQCDTRFGLTGGSSTDSTNFSQQFGGGYGFSGYGNNVTDSRMTPSPYYPSTQSDVFHDYNSTFSYQLQPTSTMASANKPHFLNGLTSSMCNTTLGSNVVSSTNNIGSCYN